MVCRRGGSATFPIELTVVGVLAGAAVVTYRLAMTRAYRSEAKPLWVACESASWIESCTSI